MQKKIQDISCSECKSCPAGQYINHSCPGGNILRQDTRQCKQCKTSCSTGFFPVGSCNGASTSDTVTCEACASICPKGMYMESPCDGTSSYVSCKPCSRCPSGSYMSGTCFISAHNSCCWYALLMNETCHRGVMCFWKWQ